MSLAPLLLSCVFACSGPDDTGSTPSDDTGTTPDSPTDDSADTDTDTDVPVDADGDGWPTPEDCDDASPYTHPEAEEWCDPVDHDCDGEELEEGVCAKTQMIEAIEAPWIDGDIFRDEVYEAVFAGNLDGEPGDELLMKTRHSLDDGVSSYGSLAVVSRLPHEPGTSITDLADHIFMRSWGGMGEWQGTGDFNGDGNDDFIVFEGGDDAGILDLFLGPSSDWPAVAFTYDAASVVWQEPRPDNSGSIADFVDGQGDVNGDGLAEILVESNNDYYQNVLILGREETPAGGDTLREETLNTTRDGRDYALGPDLDGDGLDDILGLYSGFHYISGAEVPLGEASVWEDLGAWVHFDLYGEDNCQLMDGSRPPLLRAGDWTGDGIDDLGFHCDEDLGTSNGEDPTLYLVDGAALAATAAGPGLLDIAHGPWTMLPDSIETSAAALPLGDLDEDGQDDLWFTACGRRDDASGCRYYLLRSSDGLPGPYTDPRDAGYVLSLTVPALEGDAIAYITGSGDLNGDGHTDLTIQLYDEIVTGSEQSSIRLVMGWDLPWDEPAYW